MQVVNAVIPNPAVAAEFFAGPDDGPFVMVNLLRFRPMAEYPDGADLHLTGRGAYDRYGAGVRTNIAGLLTEVLPAATVVEQMAAEATARLTVR